MVNFFDIFIIIVAAGFAVCGFREGFFRAFIKLSGFFALLVVLYLFSNQISLVARKIPFISDKISVPVLFVVLFILGQLLINTTAYSVYKIVHFTPLGFIDSGMGTALGVLKGIVFCGVISFLVIKMPHDSFFRKQLTSSYMGKELSEIVSCIAVYMNVFFRNNLI